MEILNDQSIFTVFVHVEINFIYTDGIAQMQSYKSFLWEETKGEEINERNQSNK